MSYNQLQKMRKDSRMTIEQMSNELNISKAFYWQIENGHRRLSYPMAVKIAKIFDNRPDSIFYDDAMKLNEEL
jgi:putative transcriptional regulator